MIPSPHNFVSYGNILLVHRSNQFGGSILSVSVIKNIDKTTISLLSIQKGKMTNTIGNNIINR